MRINCTAHLKVLPDISHGALNEDVASFFLQRFPPTVQLVNCVQVVHAADSLPLITLKVLILVCQYTSKQKANVRTVTG